MLPSIHAGRSSTDNAGTRTPRPCPRRPRGGSQVTVSEGVFEHRRGQLRAADRIQQATVASSATDASQRARPCSAAISSSTVAPTTVAPCCRASASAAKSVPRSEEHTSELQSLMRISYAVFCLKKKKTKQHNEK